MPDSNRVEGQLLFSKFRQHNRRIRLRCQMIDDNCCHGDMLVAWKPAIDKIARALSQYLNTWLIPKGQPRFQGPLSTTR